jgi:transcriptional regulator with XRE-family HTH domain
MNEWAEDPALFRRRLRSELRRAREANNMSQKEVALAMDWSVSKLIRIETGAVTITTNDLRALLSHYNINDRQKVETLVETAKKSRERSAWWTEFKDVATPELLALCGYESSAKVIRNFEPLLIPGLLQTEEYAQNILQHIRGPKDPRRLEGLVKLRLQRQELLAGDGRQALHYILDEGVVRRVVGGIGVMRKQLQQLRELAQSPGVTIGIVPFSHGMYRGLRVPYVVFEFDDPQDETILYLENPQGESVIFEENAAPDEDEGVPTPAVYLEVFWELEQVAPPEDTLTILDDAIRSLSTPSVDLRSLPGSQTSAGAQLTVDPQPSTSTEPTPPTS